jgi:hypothetical protein
MGLEHEVTYDRDQRHLVVRSLASPGAVPWRFISDGTDLWQCVSGMNHGEQLTVRRGPDGTATVLDIATFEFLPDPWPDL